MAKIKNLLLVLAVLLIAGFYSYQSAYGWRIIGQTNELFAVGTKAESEHSYLYKINPVTGETALIGDTGFNNCTGLDFTSDDKLKSFCEFRDDPQTLTNNIIAAGATVELDIDDGAGEWAVPHGVTNSISDITIREEGSLFSYENLETDNLHRHDEEDDFMAMLVGNPEIDSEYLGMSSWGLSDLKVAASVDDTPWYFSVDPETAAVTSLGALSFPDAIGAAAALDISNRAVALEDIEFISMDRIAGVDIPQDQDTKTSAGITGYAFEEENADQAVLMATISEEKEAEASARGIQRVDWAAIGLLDQETLEVDYIVDLQNPGFIIQAIALRPLPPSQVPTLSEWGLIATAILLFAGALFFFRRKSAIG